MSLCWTEILAKYWHHGIWSKFEWLRFHPHLCLFVVISEDLLLVGSGKSILWVMALLLQRYKETGECLTVAPGNIRPGWGLPKSRRWKTGSAQAVTLMWAPSWINELVTYLWCRVCRKEALAHGNGVTAGMHLSCQCLNLHLERLAELEGGSAEDCFAGIAEAALWRETSVCVGLWTGTKVLCSFKTWRYRVLFLLLLCCTFVALLVSVPSIGK